MNPKTTVVIPTYNRAALVANAIESVLAQTRPVEEIIVVDDGSTDSTGEILRRDYGGRIRYFYQPNQGQSAARNVGLTEARGDWVGFLDSDDVWRPEKLQYQVGALDAFRDKCQVCFTDVGFAGSTELTSTVFRLRGEDGRGAVGMVRDAVRLILDHRLRMPPIWLQSVVVRADLARAAGGFDERIRGVGEDEDFIFRLALKTGFCYVNRPLTIVDRSSAALRHTGPSALWDQPGFQLGQTQYRYEKQLRLCQDMPRDIQRTVRIYLARTHSAWANYYLERGDTRKARGAMSVSLRYVFSPGFIIKRLLVSVIPSLTHRLTVMNDAKQRARKKRQIGPTTGRWAGSKHVN